MKSLPWRQSSSRSGAAGSPSKSTIVDPASRPEIRKFHIIQPVVVNHNGTEVRFCCKECLPEFNKDPDKYAAMVKAGKAGSTDHSGHNH